MKPRPVFPLADARTVADDGDAASFCTTCAFSHACHEEGVGKRELAELHVLVDHVGPVKAGEHVFRKGDPFDAIAAVRAGTVKTYVNDADGNERVLGFHLPGEVIGLDGIDGQRYPCNAVALDTVMLCRFSFQRMSELAARLPGLQRQLFRLLSRDIGAAIRLGNDATADQRMAAFLIGLSQRLAARGFSATRFHLTMPRTDIGNHLRLAPETVSRVLKRFQDDGLIDIGSAIRLGNDANADQRMAAFLLGLSQRLAARGFSATRFHLTMSRTDIGNHLRLAPETVSRVLKRFQDDGLIDIDRREVELTGVEGLKALAAPILSA